MNNLKENKKGKFKLVIKNNENEEVLLDVNTNGIMTALTEEERVRQIILTNSTTGEIIHMLKVLNDIIEEQKKEITKEILNHINLKR